MSLFCSAAIKSSTVSSGVLPPSKSLRYAASISASTRSVSWSRRASRFSWKYSTTRSRYAPYAVRNESTKTITATGIQNFFDVRNLIEKSSYYPLLPDYYKSSLSTCRRAVDNKRATTSQHSAECRYVFLGLRQGGGTPAPRRALPCSRSP